MHVSGHTLHLTRATSACPESSVRWKRGAQELYAWVVWGVGRCLGCGEVFGCGDGVVTGCLYPYTHILVMLKG